MKKLLFSLMTMLLCATYANAQQKPLKLGKSHALQRVEVKNRYLLLPVQEREGNATIKVLANNQQV